METTITISVELTINTDRDPPAWDEDFEPHLRQHVLYNLCNDLGDFYSGNFDWDDGQDYEYQVSLGDAWEALDGSM